MANFQIPYGRQEITDADIAAVVEVLKSDFLTQGPAIKDFENAFAEYVGAKYAVAVSNGTAALHIGALALGLMPGQKVITTPITFAASANCIRYCGADVVFADIDPETYLLDVNCVRKLLESAPAGTYKGIIPVNFAGRVVDLAAFRKLADEFGLWILEDACHSPGALYIDSEGIPNKCGNGKLAEATVFSFHPVKHIATGEGGMVTTNDPEIYRKLMLLRTHGITREESEYRNDPEIVPRGGWYYEMTELGFNYRLTDFQAALGKSQLRRADSNLQKRREIAQRYYNEFKGRPFIAGQSGVVDGHAYHLYVIEVDDRGGLYSYLRERGIFAQIHYVPCHLMPYYSQFGWKAGDLPNAEKYYKHCISLPMYPTLGEEEQSFVIKSVIEYFER